MSNNDNSYLRNFLEIPYDKLEILNLEAKKRRLKHLPESNYRNYYLEYLKKETKLKAVIVGFCDLEGRFHMLDYDKKFFLSNFQNLTFDGSSIRGFSRLAESDLRLKIDWPAFWWLPSDVFGAGKILIMSKILAQDLKPYLLDTRTLLIAYLEQLKKQFGYTVNVANEVEGFLLSGQNVEKNYNEREGFKIADQGGYYHSLPQDLLKIFIDRTAEAQRAMAFENEKDHPEVAPSQFELNYSYTEADIAADQILIYKLTARQIAKSMGLTATFLPKPIAGINGSGMHTNLSISKGGKNLFYSESGKAKLSKLAWQFIEKVLHNTNDICLIMNSSVNSYRRLDPNFEAPNEIKVSKTDRGSMIRIPLFDQRSARIEFRSVAPDANPYLTIYSLIKTGLEGPMPKNQNRSKRTRVKFLPGNIQTAIQQFRQSKFTSTFLPSELKKNYLNLKQTVANRSPVDLGTQVKNNEVIYHHEVYNQLLWNQF
ncbi:MAG: Glutamine synthetase [Candidatus Beckwithbacteria bacterium GW2011_GWA2_43_10]|uniref:Glutamine synthetase n=1 Tax=Candidatus Beckwithbacteria bacterium GW2011_GWA2_43_10 TaxID=1618369 RepID=A0A0G1BZN9_9BACT|nr:MAG: Glutamine synthetase [Candidatus Beckwithbacteria bacterium GW2011_GWA2_43_10]